MNSVTFDLETITPLFLGGADGQPEMRAPSFKGLMRYWWRAVRGDEEIALKTDEDDLFGSTAQKAPFKIKLISSQPKTGRFNPLPHKDTSRFTFPGIVNSHKFKIELYGNNTILPYCEAVFKIAFLLGGVGKRSRRGFGSLSYSPEITSSMNELPNNLFESLKIIKDDFTLTSSNPIIKRKSSSNYNYPFIKEIYLGNKAFSDSQELLMLIGKASHDQCDRALGNATPRMASPVVVSICKIDSRFFPIITKMNSSFPQDYPRYNKQKQNDFIKQVTGV